MKPKECNLSSYANLPTTILPEYIERQLMYIGKAGDLFAEEYECKICKKRLVLSIMDYHVLHTIFPKLPCE